MMVVWVLQTLEVLIAFPKAVFSATVSAVNHSSDGVHEEVVV
jgi:hypothetical protein